MPAQWTANIVGQMHFHKITARELAKEAGMNAKYLSVVLNGHKEPKNAEERLQTALNSILDKRKRDETSKQQLIDAISELSPEEREQLLAMWKEKHSERTDRI